MEMTNNTPEDSSSTKKLSLMSKLGYGFGEAGSNCSWAMVSSYLTVFYTDVVGLAPVAISMIMLVSRIWDGINDPLFGSIAENTNFRFGRYRSWILFGMPFLALGSCLAFLNIDIAQNLKTYWCLFTYIFLGMAYTVVNLSTGALCNTMTANPEERTQLQSYRGAFSTIIGIILNAVTMPLILFFGNGSTSSSKGYFYSALLFAIVSIPFFLICFFTTKEVILQKKDKSEKKQGAGKELINSFKIAFADHDTRNIILAVTFNMIALFGRNGLMAYYYIYVLKNPMVMSAAMPAMLVGMLLTNFYAPFVLKRMNKKTAGVWASIANAATLVGFFYAGEAGLSGWIVVLSFLNGVTNLSYIVQFSLAGDVIDQNWLQTGKRTEGVTYAMISFATKVGNAVGGSVGILALAAVGYVADSNMSAGTLTKMNAIINLSPIIFFALTVFFYARVKMDNKTASENEKKVQALLKEQEIEVQDNL